MHEIIGKVTRVEGTTKKFVVRVDYQTLGGQRGTGRNDEIPIEKKVNMIVIGTTGDARDKGKT